MAKEDFCFTYYDGDAARDKAHMSRLERGAYDDIISAQRKRGHLSVPDLKKVLGKDFDTCWESLEWILKKDGDKYFIEWVDASLKKSAAHSKKQKEKIDKYWEKKRTTDIPQNNNGITMEEPLKEKPLEDGYEDGDGYGDKEENKWGSGENKKSALLIPKMMEVFLKANPEYPTDDDKDFTACLSIAKWMAKKSNIEFGLTEKFIQELIPPWERFSQAISEDNFYKNYSLFQVNQHKQSIVLSIQNGSRNNNKSNSKPTGNEYKQALNSRLGKREPV